MNYLKRILWTIVFVTVNCCLYGQEEGYTWKNVPIGGGGYITGMVIHPMDADKRYYRTDVGGAYRYDPASGTMIQMIKSEIRDHYSVEGIALHPTNTSELYLAVGRNCGTSSALLKSTDAGLTFTELSINYLNGVPPLSFAGNGGRNCPGGSDLYRQGNPIAVNPLNTNQLYVGARSNGLYIINLVTMDATQIAHSEIPHNTNQVNVRSIVFHPTENYVYIAYPEHGFYRGETDVFPPDFQRYTTTGLTQAMDISISKNADYLMVANLHQGVAKATNITGNMNWSSMNIPTANPLPGDGYLVVSCSPHDNDVVLTIDGEFRYIDNLLISTNRGNSWSTLSSAEFPNSPEDNIFTYNELIGSHVAEIAFDSEDVNSIHITGWFTSFQTNNFSPNGNLIWHNRESLGHEEVVTTDIISFPTNNIGNNLIIGSADHTPFVFDDRIELGNIFPEHDIRETFTNSTQVNETATLDFCETNSNHLIACLTKDQGNNLGEIYKSEDGGNTWSLTNYSDGNKGIVALASQDTDNHIVLNEDRLLYTTNNGASYQEPSNNFGRYDRCNNNINYTCLGATDFGPGKAINSIFTGYRGISADRNHDCVFYYLDWDNGDFSISTDKGERWCRISSDLPGASSDFERSRLGSIPGHPGHLWININNKLFRSTDYGVSWSQLNTIPNNHSVRAFSFGKGLDGTDYEALYIFTESDQLDDQIYRSDDRGMSWIQITNHFEGELWGSIKFLEGDRNVPGRVYATASGQGVLYGDSDLLAQCDNEEKLVNGEFDDINNPNIPDWDLTAANGATADGFINAFDKAVVDVGNIGTQPSSIQLSQDGISLINSKVYLIQTNIRADQDRNVTIQLRNKTTGAILYEQETHVRSVNTFFNFVFQSNSTISNGEVSILLGGDGSSIYVDEVRLREFCEGDINTINCHDYLYLKDHRIISDGYISRELIESDGTISSSDHTTFSSNIISLNPGFEAQQGAIFEALLDGCD